MIALYNIYIIILLSWVSKNICSSINTNLFKLYFDPVSCIKPCITCCLKFKFWGGGYLDEIAFSAGCFITKWNHILKCKKHCIHLYIHLVLELQQTRLLGRRRQQVLKMLANRNLNIYISITIWQTPSAEGSRKTINLVVRLLSTIFLKSNNKNRSRYLCCLNNGTI